jgi:hypothetical protein
LVTMKLDHPWVPLEVLANGTAEVNADIYMLTPDRIYAGDLARLDGESPEGAYIPHAPGLAVQYQQPISAQLHKDLSSDKNMGWLKPGGWLTYLTLSAPANTVTYDMGVSASGVIHVAAYGTRPMLVADGRHDLGSVLASGSLPGPTETGLPPGVGTLLRQMALLIGLGGLLLIAWRRRLREVPKGGSR